MQRSGPHDGGVATSLLLLADGRLPVGAHAYSAGVEAAAARGDLDDLAGLERLLVGRLATTGVTEAAFAARAAAGADDVELLGRLDAALDARTASPALRATSRQLGRRLLRVARSVWPVECFAALDAATAEPHQAVALGVVTAAGGGGPDDAIALGHHHLAAAVTGSAVRLRGFDPTAVVALQRRAVTQVVRDHADEARTWASADPDELPAWSGALTEILAEDHASWDARLFVG